MLCDYRNLPVKFLGQRSLVVGGHEVDYDAAAAGDACKDTIRYFDSLRSRKIHRYGRDKRLLLDILPDELEIRVKSRKSSGGTVIRIPLPLVEGVGIIGRQFALQVRSEVGSACDTIYAFETQRRGDDAVLLSSLFGSIVSLHNGESGGAAQPQEPAYVSTSHADLEYEVQMQRTVALQADKARLEAELRAMTAERECEALRRERAELQAEMSALAALMSADLAEIRSSEQRDVADAVRTELSYLKRAVALVAARLDAKPSRGRASAVSADAAPAGAAFAGAGAAIDVAEAVAEDDDENARCREFLERVGKVSDEAVDASTPAARATRRGSGDSAAGNNATSTLLQRLSNRVEQFAASTSARRGSRFEAARHPTSASWRSVDSGLARSNFATERQDSGDSGADAELYRAVTQPLRAPRGSGVSDVSESDAGSEVGHLRPTRAVGEPALIVAPLVPPERKRSPEAAVSADAVSGAVGGAGDVSSAVTVSPVKSTGVLSLRASPVRHEVFEDVEILRHEPGQSLGLGISGGTDTPVHPGDTAIYVSNIVQGGPAHATGCIFPGDRLVCANGVDLETATHQRAVEALRSAGDGPVTLTLVRPADVPGGDVTNYSTLSEQTTIVEDMLEISFPHTDEGLGFIISGGVDHRVSDEDSSIYVTQIIESGPAHRHGHLRVGDRLLKVNGVSTVNVTHAEAVAALRRSVGGRVNMIVSRLPPQEEEVLTIDFPIGEEGLGFSIFGGVDQVEGPDTGVIVLRIMEGGAAAADGRLQCGDRLLEANGCLLANAAHDEAAGFLASIAGHVTLKIARLVERYDVVLDVVLKLPSTRQGIGFSIAGGSDESIGEGDPGIYVTQIVEGGFAHLDGQLRFGDKILMVNGVDVTDVPHEMAISAIKNAGSELRIQLARLPSADEDADQVLQVHLSCGGKKLGMQISGGTDREYDGDAAVYIDQISEDGAAATDGRLQVGDKLLVCNGKNLSAVTHQEARQWLVDHLDDLRLTISRRRDDAAPAQANEA